MFAAIRKFKVAPPPAPAPTPAPIEAPNKRQVPEVIDVEDIGNVQVNAPKRQKVPEKMNQGTLGKYLKIPEVPKVPITVRQRKENPFSGKNLALKSFTKTPSIKNLPDFYSPAEFNKVLPKKAKSFSAFVTVDEAAIEQRKLDDKSVHKRPKFVGAFEEAKSERKQKRLEAERLRTQIQKEKDAIEKNFIQSIHHDELVKRELKMTELNQKLRSGVSLLDDDDEYYAGQTEMLALYKKQITEDRHVVVGQGSLQADLMIIDGIPTDEETQMGKAFAGKRGTVFQNMLRKLDIDPKRHCYFTYLMKIKPPKRQPTFDEIEDHLAYLRAEIKIIKPKQIVCLGQLVSTLGVKSFELDEDIIRSKSVRIGQEFEDGIYQENLFNLQKYGLTNKAIYLHDLSHVSRVFMMEDFSYFMSKKGDEYPRTAWLQKLGTIKDNMCLPRIPYIDLEEELENFHAERGKGNLKLAARAAKINFTQPTDLLFDRTLNNPRLPRDYVEQLKVEKKNLRFYLTEKAFLKADNSYVLFGKLEGGNSISLVVEKQKFRFWINHNSFMPQADEKKEVNFERPDINLIRKSLLVDILGSMGSSKGKFSTMSSEDLEEYCGFDVKYVKKRSSVIYQPKRSIFLEISFNNYSQGPKIREYVEDMFGGCVFFEDFVTPFKYLNLYSNVFMYGWVEVDPYYLRALPRKRTTTSDLEYAVEVGHVQGKNPNRRKGKPIVPEDESHERIRILQFDGEMIKLHSTSNGMPVPERDPIGRLCAYVSDTNDSRRPTISQVLRSPKEKEEREAVPSGRVNYTDAVSFIVGIHEEIEATKFKPKTLPWAPYTPIPRPSRSCRKHNHRSLTAIYLWNQFIDKCVSWIRYVGRYRARLILPNLLYQKLIQHIDFPGSVQLELPDKDKSDKDIYIEWRRNIMFFAHRWRLKKPDANIELPDYQPDSTYTSEVDIGEIQFRWHLFNPKGKQFFFKDERSMLASFVEYCRQADIDGFAGHNITGFDITYIIKRIQCLNLRWNRYWKDRGSNIISLGRGGYVPHGPLTDINRDLISTKTMDTMANGKRVFSIIDIPGKFVFDTLHWAQRDGPAGLPGFTLQELAKVILLDKKGDLPWSSIPIQFFTRPQNLTVYCKKDAEICDRVTNFCDILSFLLTSCRVGGDLTIGEYYTTGVQRKNLSKYLSRLRDSGLDKLLPSKNPFSAEDGNFEFEDMGKENNNPGDDEDDLDDEENVVLNAQSLPAKERAKRIREYTQGFLHESEDGRGSKRQVGYQGARVIKPVKDCYREPIPTLDFASLYPSIMRAENLGTNTVGTLEHFLSLGKKLEDLYTSGELYPNPFKGGEPCLWYFLKRVHYTKEEAEQLPGDDDDIPAGLDQCFQHPDGTYSKKIDESDFAAVLTELGDLRSHFKAMKAKVGSKHPLFKAYEAAQIAIKIWANSVYGATGVTVGMLSCLPIGATVTCEGRNTITEVEQWMINIFHAKVVGGDTDSVFVSFPQIKVLEDVYKPTDMLDNPDQPESETNKLVTRPFIDHVVTFINRRQKKGKSIVFEKAMWPFLNYAPKKADYGNNEPIEDPITKKPMFKFSGTVKMVSKGTEGKRRSTAPYAKTALDTFDKLMWSRMLVDEDERKAEAMAYIRGVVQDLMDGKFNYNEMIISSYYGKSEDQYDNPNHPTLVLNRKRIRRGEEPYELGSRVPRVVLYNDNPKAKMWERVEDPIYAMKHSLLLDIEYYINKQLKIPLRRKIQYFNDCAAMEAEMFAPMTVVGNALKPGEPLHAHFGVRCINCEITTGTQLICDSCARTGDSKLVLGKLKERKAPIATKLNLQREICYDCLGMEIHGEIPCSNVYCPELPRRIILETDVKKIEVLEEKVILLMDF